MRPVRLAAATLLFASLPAWSASPAATPSLAGFEDAIHHWRNVHGDAYPRHAPDEVANIADNILRYQRIDGGWIENQDPARILDDAERARFDIEARKSGGSFDNRNIYTQLDYLATAYAITGDTRYRDGSLRGIAFTLAQVSLGRMRRAAQVPAE